MRFAVPRNFTPFRRLNSMSLFSAVELAPRDPILGMTEAFNADPNPAKVNLGVGVYFDEQGKLPILQCVLAAERQTGRVAETQGLPADRRHSSLRPRRAGAGIRRADRGAARRAHRHGADTGRHRRPEGGRRFPPAPECGRPGADQRPQLGKPPRLVHPGGLRGRHLSVLRRRHPRHPLRGHAGGTECGRCPEPWSCCTPVATTRPAATWMPSSGHSS